LKRYGLKKQWNKHYDRNKKRKSLKVVQNARLQNRPLSISFTRAREYAPHPYLTNRMTCSKERNGKC
jgi:hypothetical protein